MLSALEGAIRGVRWHDIAKPQRAELWRRCQTRIRAQQGTMRVLYLSPPAPQVTRPHVLLLSTGLFHFLKERTCTSAASHCSMSRELET
jgi:hypothetical protein